MTPAYDRLIVGTPTEVAAVLRTAQRRGVLVAVTAPRSAADGRVVVKARMTATARVPAIDAVPPVSARRSRSIARCAGVAAAAGGALVAAAGVAYAVVWLVAVAWPLLLAAVVVCFVLRRVQVRTGVCCPGLHCPGCSH